MDIKTTITAITLLATILGWFFTAKNQRKLLDMQIKAEQKKSIKTREYEKLKIIEDFFNIASNHSSVYIHIVRKIEKLQSPNCDEFEKEGIFDDIRTLRDSINLTNTLVWEDLPQVLDIARIYGDTEKLEQRILDTIKWMSELEEMTNPKAADLTNIPISKLNRTGDLIRTLIYGGRVSLEKLISNWE